MSRIVLIDNNDSFTYNVVDIIRNRLRADLTVLRYGDFVIDELKQYDHIIISPGPSLPSDYPLIFNLLDVYKDHKNILGICLGHQAVCHYFGMQLYNLSNVVHGQSREIRILDNRYIFSGLPQTISVGLYHSWAADINTVNESIVPTAISADGVLMAVKSSKYNTFGIQFHPESFLTPHGIQILSNFINITNV